MTCTIDLHVHTNASDGLHRPDQVVHMAIAAGITTLGICDHDAVDGIAPAQDAARSDSVMRAPGASTTGTPIEIVPGVEISTESDDREVHLLGLWIDWTDQKLNSELALLRGSRVTRGLAIFGKLRDLGMSLSWERVREIAGEGALGRPHLARALQEAGYVANTREAFDLYLARGRPAYVPRHKVSIPAALQLIHQCGGVPVLAHPWGIETLVPYLVGHGLRGLEVYYPGYDAAMTASLKDLAARYSLACSGGSDFHGSALLPENKLGGVQVPQACLEALRARRPVRA